MKIFKKFKPYQIIYLRSITDKQIKLELSQILCSKAERFFIPTDIRIMHPTFAVPDCGYIYTIPQYPIINPQNKNEILTNSELNKMKLEYNYLNVIHLLELFSQNYPQDGGGSSLYGYSFVPWSYIQKIMGIHNNEQYLIDYLPKYHNMLIKDIEVINNTMIRQIVNNNK